MVQWLVGQFQTEWLNNPALTIKPFNNLTIKPFTRSLQVRKFYKFLPLKALKPEWSKSMHIVNSP